MVVRPSAGPLLVFGPRSLEYDFGPGHPLSPRRFGPGIDLLRAVGAEPGLEPEPATDQELGWLHSPEYVATVRRIAADPDEALVSPQAGIGPGDDPPFRGMHEAAAVVAGGSIRAVEAILRGDVEHAYQPGGGLHHAMRSKASGFCIYNDVALAIARARREGLRVLYVDLDVHHGDGVQALHYSDPDVMTISFHESGRWLFPGTGFVDELGEGTAAATSINVPLEPMSGPGPWLAAVRSVVPVAAAAFGPDLVVSQHGADGHVWDPLAHLSLTTAAMAEAARLVDAVAHRYAGGRWFATGGGGYSVYRVVPRVWALTWLAGAHRESPGGPRGGSGGELPTAWLDRWAGDAARWDDAPLPTRFEDEPGVVSGRLASESAGAKDEETVDLVRVVMVPALLRVAERGGLWRFAAAAADSPARGGAPASHATPAAGGAARVVVLGAGDLDKLRLAPRVVAPVAPEEAWALLRMALDGGATACGAVSGEWLVGVAVSAPIAGSAPVAGSAPIAGSGVQALLAVGVAPEWRRRGLATSLLRGLLAETDRAGRGVVALHTVAERDPIDPLPREVRRGVATRLLAGAGFSIRPAPSAVAAADPGALAAVHLPPSPADSLAAAAERVLGRWREIFA
jgi:acetoin utilization protein AcuC